MPPKVEHDPLPLLRACVSAMTQMCRERGGPRANQPRSSMLWDDALRDARAAIAYHDERANTVVIDLDAEAWKALKEAIQKSPRFQEMYQAGGTFTDACASVRLWLEEEEPVYALNAAASHEFGGHR